jgi:cytochrome c
MMKHAVIGMAAVASLAIANGAMGAAMPQLARELNCTSCHAIELRKMGPAWQDVAARYKGATTFKYKGKNYPLVEGLVMKVSRGGVGNWGSMPMPANDPSGSKKAEITQLVKFILGLVN